MKVGERIESKAGTAVAVDAPLEVDIPQQQFVSRGGIKLEHALVTFEINLEGSVALDVGSSTGGFTDCMLTHGARLIYAVDVGKGQLHHRLRTDSRVVALEGFNARYMTEKEVPEKVQLITADLSFISLAKVLPVLRNFLSSDGRLIALIKPQFEAERRHNKKGVVRDREIHCQVIEKVAAQAGEASFSAEKLTYSPIKGPSGNIEFFLLLSPGTENTISSLHIRGVVEEAHHLLDVS